MRAKTSNFRRRSLLWVCCYPGTEQGRPRAFRAGTPKEARRLAVAEDAAEVVGRTVGEAHRLREEHGALAVVPVRMIHQLDRHELAVVELLALQLGDELRPRRAHDERFERPGHQPDAGRF